MVKKIECNDQIYLIEAEVDDRNNKEMVTFNLFEEGKIVQKSVLGRDKFLQFTKESSFKNVLPTILQAEATKFPIVLKYSLFHFVGVDTDRRIKFYTFPISLVTEVVISVGQHDYIILLIHQYGRVFSILLYQIEKTKQEYDQPKLAAVSDIFKINVKISKKDFSKYFQMIVDDKEKSQTSFVRPFFNIWIHPDQKDQILDYISDIVLFHFPNEQALQQLESSSSLIKIRDLEQKQSVMVSFRIQDQQILVRVKQTKAEAREYKMPVDYPSSILPPDYGSNVFKQLLMRLLKIKVDPNPPPAQNRLMQISPVTFSRAQVVQVKTLYYQQPSSYLCPVVVELVDLKRFTYLVRVSVLQTEKCLSFQQVYIDEHNLNSFCSAELDAAAHPFVKQFEEFDWEKFVAKALFDEYMKVAENLTIFNFFSQFNF